MALVPLEAGARDRPGRGGEGSPGCGRRRRPRGRSGGAGAAGWSRRLRGSWTSTGGRVLSGGELPAALDAVCLLEKALAAEEGTLAEAARRRAAGC